MTPGSAYEPSPRQRERDQVALYEDTDGTQGGTLNGRPVVILTHTGAKSGLPRKSPLMRIEHDGSYAIVASNGGGSEPLWAANVATNPVVRLQDGAVTWTIRAREIFGDEKNRWWGCADATYPTFAKYRKEADREILIFLLEPE